MSSDQKCLGKEMVSEQFVVNANNTLRRVFVSVNKGFEGKIFPQPKTKATINQEGCTYHPHVLDMKVDQPLEIMNSDPTLNNVYPFPKNSPQFNIGQPKKVRKLPGHSALQKR